MSLLLHYCHEQLSCDDQGTSSVAGSSKKEVPAGLGDLAERQAGSILPGEHSGASFRMRQGIARRCGLSCSVVLQPLASSGASSSPVERRSGQLAAAGTWDPSLGKKPCANM